MGQLFYNLGLAYFAAGRDRDCVEALERTLSERPEDVLALGFLASSFGHLGRVDQAKITLERLAALNPRISIRQVQSLPAFALMTATFGDRVLDGLRKAGLKE